MSLNTTLRGTKTARFVAGLLTALTLSFSAPHLAMAQAASEPAAAEPAPAAAPMPMPAPAPAPLEAMTEKQTIDNPYGLRGAVEAGRPGGQGHSGDHADHVDGQLVRHLHQAVGAEHA